MSVLQATGAIVLATLSGCSCAGNNNGVPPRGEDPIGHEQPKQPATMRVGNQAAGVDEQPDYDREALLVREQVEGQLPDPLPSARKACGEMFAAVVAAYARAEGDNSPPVRTMMATRPASLKACESETSPAAASCVAILAESEGGEFPWLLDQCSRAFP